MSINFRIINSTYATKKITIANNSFILNYPCGEKLDECSPYFTHLRPGSYIFEVWGAQGGFNGGKGGYSRGIFNIDREIPLYVYVGAHGGKMENESGFTTSAFNGGGKGLCAHTEYAHRSTGSGGGGSDIRIIGKTPFHRLIVAGGGGGQSDSYGMSNVPIKFNGTAGYGGGLVGGDAAYGKGGLQDSCPDVEDNIGQGTFGEGGSATLGTSGGGGGGWYGGSSGKGVTASGGAGGSGYVLNASSFIPDNYELNDTQYYLIKGRTFNGVSEFPVCENDIQNEKTEKGHEGHGCVRITILSQMPLCTINSQHAIMSVLIKISTCIMLIKI